MERNKIILVLGLCLINTKILAMDQTSQQSTKTKNNSISIPVPSNDNNNRHREMAERIMKLLPDVKCEKQIIDVLEKKLAAVNDGNKKFDIDTNYKNEITERRSQVKNNKNVDSDDSEVDSDILRQMISLLNKKNDQEILKKKKDLQMLSTFIINQLIDEQKQVSNQAQSSSTSKWRNGIIATVAIAINVFQTFGLLFQKYYACQNPTNSTNHL